MLILCLYMVFSTTSTDYMSLNINDVNWMMHWKYV
jgi:hypothetical protein